MKRVSQKPLGFVHKMPRTWKGATELARATGGGCLNCGSHVPATEGTDFCYGCLEDEYDRWAAIPFSRVNEHTVVYTTLLHTLYVREFGEEPFIPEQIATTTTNQKETNVSTTEAKCLIPNCEREALHHPNCFATSEMCPCGTHRICTHHDDLLMEMDDRMIGQVLAVLGLNEEEFDLLAAATEGDERLEWFEELMGRCSTYSTIILPLIDARNG